MNAKPRRTRPKKKTGDATDGHDQQTTRGMRDQRQMTAKATKNGATTHSHVTYKLIADINIRGRSRKNLGDIDKPTVTLTNQTTSLNAASGKHSAKPEAFYEMVEALCPGSKLEMFSRQRRKGWKQHGDETEKEGDER